MMSKDSLIYRGEDAIFIDFTDYIYVINASDKNIIIMLRHNVYYIIKPYTIRNIRHMQPVSKVDDEEASRVNATPGNFKTFENKSDTDMVIKHSIREHYYVVRAHSCGCFVNP